MLIEEKLKRIHELVNNATPGPWYLDTVGEIRIYGHNDRGICRLTHPNINNRKCDASFISILRTDLPWLLDLISDYQFRLQSQLDLIDELYDEMEILKQK